VPTHRLLPDGRTHVAEAPPTYSLEEAEPHVRVWALLLAGGVYLLSGQLDEAHVAAALAGPDAAHCCDECRQLLDDFNGGLRSVCPECPQARRLSGVSLARNRAEVDLD
jgi:hypothetical protein